jgi:hypothetical protein
MQTKNTTRRAVLAGIATAPALAAPAIGVAAGYSEDAEIPALGVQLKPIEEDFAAQLAIDRASTTFTVVQQADGTFETDMEPWDDIHDRLDPLAKEILSKKARTIPGLAVQARALLLVAREIWEPVFMSDKDHERKFIESVCAFVGVPLPDVGAVS